MKLSTLFQNKKYDTDKYDLGYINHIYDEFLQQFVNKPVKFLEIGIFNGGSIKMWKEYFHQDSKLFCMDINYCKNLENESHITQITKNAYCVESANQFDDNYFDVIIDDGPHTIESFILLIDLYYNKINKNGFLVIEDIINTSWTPILVNYAKSKGYKIHSVHNMAGKQKTEKLLNLWQTGLDVVILQK